MFPALIMKHVYKYFVLIMKPTNFALIMETYICFDDNVTKVSCIDNKTYLFCIDFETNLFCIDNETCELVHVFCIDNETYVFCVDQTADGL